MLVVLGVVIRRIARRVHISANINEAFRDTRTFGQRLSDRVAVRMRRAGFVGRTVQLRVRFADFTTITRSKTLPDSTDVGQDIYRTALALYDGLGLQRVRLRLVGVRVEQLIERSSATEQLLLGAPERGWRDAEEALDRVRDRFGPASVQPARLLDRTDPYQGLRAPPQP